MGITGNFAFVPLHEAVSERSLIDGVAIQSVQPSGTQLCPTQSRELHTALSSCVGLQSMRSTLSQQVSQLAKTLQVARQPPIQ